MWQTDIRVDNEKHVLHFGGHDFPCDRDIETALGWNSYALLLSSDTDCLSLWDRDGLLRLAKVGVYPQDMALAEDMVAVCGGADGKLHLLQLPDLAETTEYLLPGMPERLCIADGAAYILTLLTEPEVHTRLLMQPLNGEPYATLRQLPGIPEAITADKSGLWIAVSEGVTRLLWTDIKRAPIFR